MSNRVPIFGDKRLNRWRRNFKASPFEVKVITVVVVLTCLASFSILVPNHVGIIAMGIGSPACFFWTQAVGASLRLSLREQTLAKQLEYRALLIATLLGLLLFYWLSPTPFKRYNQSDEDYRLILLYRPYGAFWWPLLLALIMSVRTVPMTIKYFKLKRQERLSKVAG